MRLVLPRRGRRASLRGLAAFALLLAGCGSGDEQDPAKTARTEPVRPPALPAEGLAIGMTEANPHLIRADAVGEGFAPWRDRLAAMRPPIYRLVVDWAQLQPDPSRPADLEQPRDGCGRSTPPCGPWGGIRDQLRAVRSRQLNGGGFVVSVVFYGVPEWAALGPRGCERDNIEPRSRPINDRGLQAFRVLIRDLLALAKAEKVELRSWSTWNEPNGPFFISPQRERCSARSAPVSPRVYARLFRALRAELEAAPGEPQLIIGELAGVAKAGPRGSGVGEFLRALPDDVVCNADILAQHEYAELPEEEEPTTSVAEAIEAIDERPCARDMPVWVTETGIGGAHAGDDRPTSAQSLRRQCFYFHRQLRDWHANPRVQVAVQYTFREDSAFPVGVADAGLGRAYPTYDLLQAWAGDRRPSDPPPALPARCRR